MIYKRKLGGKKFQNKKRVKRKITKESYFVKNISIAKDYIQTDGQSRF